MKGSIRIAKVDPRFEQEILRWMLQHISRGTVRSLCPLSASGRAAPWRGY